ncbi:MAG: Uma2 family endonuclease [Nostoc sp. DedVER02]|uniref:Uma2 family endonuclease n=1 Tax=unclassified Nostoc TaxID=2593658 RepID=UPI002AD494E5|nr:MULTISPECIES: Uma2 family endonuclease [unclassified Nostoc]MDZ7987155.1 Uma2 family endonuclease [Nostoc sp. DedVER02]MDZ8110975.1 Uma2 family endonuclease [Nostoc sp. DedVER01b]
MVNLSLKQRIPPLENGDRLTRYEFERRYQVMSRHQKAELIEGVVYLASPLRFESHAEPHGHTITWLGVYEASTPGVRLGIEPTVRLDRDNEPQPDGVLLITPTSQGQSRLSDDDYIEGAPELVIEIAASSVAIDLYDKKKVYGRNGVKEYIVWQIFENKLDWFSLQQGEYMPLEVDADGIIKSQVFPGLWLSMSDLLAGNMQQVLAILQLGLNSPEHQIFVQHFSR